MTTLVCPVCSARWKIVPEGEGDRPAVCPVCERATCAGCGDTDPAHWREGGWYCESCASCEVCASPYCDNPDHDL